MEKGFAEAGFVFPWEVADWLVVLPAATPEVGLDWVPAVEDESPLDGPLFCNNKTKAVV